MLLFGKGRADDLTRKFAGFKMLADFLEYLDVIIDFIVKWRLAADNGTGSQEDLRKTPRLF